MSCINIGIGCIYLPTIIYESDPNNAVKPINLKSSIIYESPKTRCIVNYFAKVSNDKMYIKYETDQAYVTTER